ncbi:xanthine dehydrogenase-like isoform X2 [Teleopsis dalmanni]|uniref:xanthine dehydrogenase-like isoform X2 n=1 Tax=Teleopsis dalmanni TaxID=139649 RepID=UPI0018CE2158|nr:xanthine dehydrogenase-like isoform X2 [Teleopsis dalmanni]
MKANFIINEVDYCVNLLNFPADITLNTFIREHAQLTATKYMCLEGGCGACICVIRGKHPVTGKLRTWAANSCLTLLNSLVNMEITTSEGIGNKRIGYHPIQKMLAKLDGSQCGFCSPGFVMNMYGLLEAKEGKVTTEEVENSFGGNLCRCTGYRPILEAMKSFAADNTYDMLLDIEELNGKSCKKAGNKCPALQQKPLSRLIYEDESQWFWPKTFEELFDDLSKVRDNEFMFVGGNTAHGVYRRNENIKSFIDINAIRELKTYHIDNEHLTLGANLSLTETMHIFKEAAQRPGFEYCEQLWKHFDLIANVPVRNNGTLAGNISTKKAYMEFTSDVFIIFETLNVQLICYECANKPQVMGLLEYLKLPSKKLLIATFSLQSFPKERYIFQSYKILPRAQNSHAYVNAGFLLEMELETGLVHSARICYGGIRPDFVHATTVEAMVIGQNLFDRETLAKIFHELSIIIQPNDVLPNASPEYRKKLACGLFYKLILNLVPAELVKPEYKSGGELLVRPISSGSQTYEIKKKNFPVNQPVEKLEAIIQCAGEATYMNDTLTTNNSLYCAFVGATRVGAKIVNIDAKEALKMLGVVAFFSAQDIPGRNTFVNERFQWFIPEEIFCSDIVQFYNQPLGLIVAITHDIAHRATTRVRVTYTNIQNQPPKLSLKQILSDNHKIETNVETKTISNIKAGTITAKGIFEMGSQYHFTMEPQTTIAIPFEERLQISSSTQWMDHTQCVIAEMLNIKVNSVQFVVRRLGGGYGAKISRCNQVACAAALAAYKLNRPVRFVQTIESMMNCNGKRWACLSDYEFHASLNGKILSLRNNFYEDAGCSLNENPINLLTNISTLNCYELTSNYQYNGQAVVTDAPSATWCRAPGSTEGIAMTENIMEHIAFETKLDAVSVRLANINPTNKMAQLLPRFIKSIEYHTRKAEIDDFNKRNRWVKCGLGISVMQFNLIFFGQFSATVSIYHCDGTVTISHAGIEMGQGINTKVAQVAAYILGIPLELVNIEATNTVNGANAMSTLSSFGSESLCYAVRKSCNVLNDRLKPVKDSLAKNSTWQQIVATAWQRSINLIASENYKQGDMQNYYIYGLACTEMKVDLLTGNHLIKRVDILEDTGESLNPRIDVGQIEGAFVMGLGYWLTEKLVYNRQTGELLTNRTWNYKPPGAKDIPIDFRIELLQSIPNENGFMRSKATGEPAFCLAVSSIFALQHALQSARDDAGHRKEYIRLGAPTTPEDIVLAAGHEVDMFTLN